MLRTIEYIILRLRPFCINLARSLSSVQALHLHLARPLQIHVRLPGNVNAQQAGLESRFHLLHLDFHREMDIPIDVVLVTELANEENEDEWVFPLEADTADLDDIVRTVFVLNMDSKLLCKEDCKGLCCRCGKNLNDGPCGCQKELDPRFAALKQLLDK